MADNQFGQIFNFNEKRAKKLENSSYLEELTGLLTKVASRIDDGSCYLFGKEYYLKGHPKEPNTGYDIFTKDLKSTLEYGSGKKIYIIRGMAGIGKTLFFDKGFKRFISISKGIDHKYIKMGVDFKNIDNDKDIFFYEDKIYKGLQANAIDNIRLLGDEIFDDFDRRYNAFGKDYPTPNTYLFPLKFFCEKVNNIYGHPCIIVFDNIDLASVNTQKSVFKAVVNICQKFSEYMEVSSSIYCYRIYFAMRPETCLHREEAKLGEVINFPLPNVLKIYLETVNRILMETAKEFDEERIWPCNIKCYNVIKEKDEMVTLESYTDVAEFFCNILNNYLGDIWDNNTAICDRLGKSEEFHCNIVNYNVRTFLQFLADTISNGGFKPLTQEFNHQSVGFYNVFDYIEMIIRGRWYVHPGNKYIDSEGGNKAPIIFNVFDTSLYRNYQDDKVKHFMLYIRILQYFCLCVDDQEVSYGEMKQILSGFFDEEHILNAIKKLTHVRMLYSFSEGDITIASQDWSEIKITNTTKLKLSPTGRFYLEKLIYEFEYLYQMALSSLMCEEYVEILNDCWKTEKEQTVLYFLNSIFKIIKKNIESYNSEELRKFKRLFYQVDTSNYCQPFRKMIDSFSSVMNSKVQRAKKMETSSSEKLCNIWEEVQSLKKEVERYFLSKLGD